MKQVLWFQEISINNNFENLCKEPNSVIPEEPEINPFINKRRDITFWFVIIVITNILINVDHGWIPAWTVTIKRDLKLDNASLGILGSVVYLGLLIGSFTSPPIFLKINAKWIILICWLFNAASLAGFTLFKDFTMLWIFRFGIGFFQVFLWIYFPVWVDIFGSESVKTIWLTILQSSVPLGVVLGYCITAFFDTKLRSWQMSYYSQSASYWLLFIIFAWIPKRILEDDPNNEDFQEEYTPTKKGVDIFSEDFIKESDESSKSNQNSSDSDSDDESSGGEGYRWERSSKADASYTNFNHNKNIK